MPDLPTLARWARKSVRRSPAETARKIAIRTRDYVGRQRGRIRDLESPTFARDQPLTSIRRLGTVETQDLSTDAAALGEASAHYLRHEFDLLGSGWVRVAHGMRCEGFGGHRFEAGPPLDIARRGAWVEKHTSPPNRAEAKRIWGLLEPGYVPIDWHLDFRSGFRWEEQTWYRDITYRDAPGIDVKVPWELARLQHLPRLAIAAALARAGKGGLEPPERYVGEIQNQLMDFIGSNPPRFGVNWATTMDVAIRAVNILLTYDLVRDQGANFDPEADAVIRRSLLEHGRHIAANLEWDPILRGNHYLADVAGLAILGANVEAPEATRWLDRGTSELIRELGLQFNPDGTNFEGSTSYHRLSTEIAIYALAAVLGTPAGATLLPADVGERIRRMVEFTSAVTGPDALVAQIGDNDSGRLVQLEPVPPGRSLDHGHLLDAATGLLGDGIAAERTTGPDRAVVAALTGRKHLGTGAPMGQTATAASVRLADAAMLDIVQKRIADLPPDARASYRFQTPGTSAVGRLTLAGYPDGGYWIAKSERFQLVIRCGRIGQSGNGGHDHNDQLSFSLWLDGEPMIRDPGSYVYLAGREERNRYRSAASHSSPLLDGPEPADLDVDPFSLGDPRPGTCLAWCDQGFAGSHVDRLGREALACIRWDAGGITIDHGVAGGTLAPSRRPPASWRALRGRVPFSPGYGLRDGS